MDFLSTFLAAYRFLDYLYVSKILLSVEPFDTVDIVSSMDPTVWLPREGERFGSGDPATIGMWKENLLTNGIDVDSSISPDLVFKGLTTFIEYHKKEYNFDAQDCLELLYNMKKDPAAHKDLWDKWKEIIAKSPEVSFNIK